jgi:hypothetical protein
MQQAWKVYRIKFSQTVNNPNKETGKNNST